MPAVPGRRPFDSLLVSFATALLSLLTACGSGGGSGADAASPGATTDAGANAAASAETAATATAKESSFEPEGEFAVETLKAINDARSVPRHCGETEYPAVPPIRWNTRVTEAARIESQWMQTHNSWGHVWPDGTNVASRLDQAEYRWRTAGENIAAGFLSLPAVMKAWLDSPGHCVNVMRADVDEVGVSLVWGEGSNTYRSYWTMVLASPQPDTIALNSPPAR